MLPSTRNEPLSVNRPITNLGFTTTNAQVPQKIFNSVSTSALPTPRKATKRERGDICEVQFRNAPHRRKSLNPVPSYTNQFEISAETPQSSEENSSVPNTEPLIALSGRTKSEREPRERNPTHAASQATSEMKWRGESTTCSWKGKKEEQPCLLTQEWREANSATDPTETAEARN
jgi:hypothetical protein